MEKKTVAELYCELDKKGYKDFMFDTADFINQCCKSIGNPPLFSIDYDSDLITVNSDFNYIKEFGNSAGESESEFDCNDRNEALNLISFLYQYNLFHCKDNEKILEPRKDYKEYFIDFQNELHITSCPQDYLRAEYTTSVGAKPAFSIDDNALFSVDRNKGTLTFNKIFKSAQECEEYILKYCEDCGYISYATADPSLMKDYYQDLIDGCDPDDLDDKEFIENCKKNLKSLDEYLIKKKHQNSEKNYKGR